MSKTWSTTELAKAAGKTRAGIWFLIKSGKIKAVKIGPVWRIEDKEARRYLESILKRDAISDHLRPHSPPPRCICPSQSDESGPHHGGACPLYDDVGFEFEE